MTPPLPARSCARRSRSQRPSVVALARPASPACFGALLAATVALSPPLRAQEPAAVGETVVVGRSNDLVGLVESATVGEVGPEELQRRPLLRPGELLETVPGIVITQHSGAGKGNQFFLRGFNLDHGTDLAVRVNGVPYNLRSHGHGQGYVDLNPLIPELVGNVRYRKGPYFADAGDFASAGSVAIDYMDELPFGFVQVESGSFDFMRTVAGDTFALDDSKLTVGIETYHNDGPWVVEDDYEKLSGVARWTHGDDRRGWRLTGEFYDADWTATDHIPKRAVDSGLIDRFGTLDPTSGGLSDRQSLTFEHWSEDGADRTDLTAYAYHYALDLYSNFTYVLDDPVNGDQFLQTDERTVLGVEAGRSTATELFGVDGELRYGVQSRADWIDNGLFRTSQRTILSTTREDEIVETSIGAYAESTQFWNGWFRSTIGLRADQYFFDVDSDLAANSGNESDGIVSPKLSLVFGPWADTEFYVNAGYGFHSNDARGTTLTDDPTTPALGDGTPVDPLVEQRGAEIGVRTTAIDGLQSTLSLWYLESDSELLFVGDAGNTEASGATERWGIEWTNFWEVNDWLTADLDAAASQARFTDAGDDDHVPGAIDTVVATGLTARSEDGHYVALRGRFFGPRDLIEDGSVESSSSFLVNLHAGYVIDEHWRVRLSVFNLLDSDESDIEYFYASRLAGEPVGGVEDVHFHPAEPFSLRLAVTATF
ncbi:Vitamin B12 transporter BtuB [Planctomycetes bacterium Pla163]|uniref:Vitamin B12 transporter BtuB n=1 Tax=Rohdeia mirabilis TaxID=2528008 RepID=A0A518D4M5_9BACT|nr:Vitamin B12 transporter BtuB [Planctomycetes bacterium Pla163]